MEFRRSVDRVRVTCIFDPSQNETLDVFTFQVKVGHPHLSHFDNIRGAIAFTLSYSNVVINGESFEGNLWSVFVNQSSAVFSFTSPLPLRGISQLQFTMHLNPAWVPPIQADESLLFLQGGHICDTGQVCFPIFERLMSYLQRYKPIYLIGMPMFVENASLESLQRYGIRVPIQTISSDNDTDTFFISTPFVQNPIRLWFLQGVPRTSFQFSRYRFDPVLEIYKQKPKPTGSRLLYVFILCICIMGVIIGYLFYRSRFKSDSL